MTTLKELTQYNHKLAENHKFTNLLISGNIPINIYSTYLANQLIQYQILEDCAKNLLVNMPDLLRSKLILEDLMELNASAVIFDTTKKYYKYVKTLGENDLWAHIYTKHMGDLYGGQIIKKKVPGSGFMYEFNNKQLLIKNLRSMLNTSMATEANKCFDFTLELFDCITNEYNI